MIKRDLYYERIPTKSLREDVKLLGTLRLCSHYAAVHRGHPEQDQTQDTCLAPSKAYVFFRGDAWPV